MKRTQQTFGKSGKYSERHRAAVRANSSNLDLSVIPCDLAGHVKQVESTSETLAFDSVVDERASQNAMNTEGISAETASAELT